MTDLEKVLKLDWTCTPFVDPKISSSRNWSMWHLLRQIPDEKIFGTGLLEVCQQNSDDDITLQMISNVYDLDNIWTLDKKWVRVLPPTPPCYLNVTLKKFQWCTLPSMWDNTPRKAPSWHWETKSPWNWKNLSRSEMLSETDIDNKGKICKTNKWKPQLNRVGRPEGKALMPWDN